MDPPAEPTNASNAADGAVGLDGLAGLARLARLDVAAAAESSADLRRILEHFASLRDLALPEQRRDHAQATAAGDRLRDDEPASHPARAAILANAPLLEDDHFRVPRVKG